MKTLKLLLLISVYIITSSLDISPREESAYTPILMTRTELEKSIQYQQPKPIEVIGKIYKKDTWVYISEKYKGVHIIDNTNPSLPINYGFISIPGCIDMAIRGNTMYADNSVDLVAIDITSFSSVKEIARFRNTFPEPFPSDLQYIPYKYHQNNRPENTIIVDWQKRVIE